MIEQGCKRVRHGNMDRERERDGWMALLEKSFSVQHDFKAVM